MNSFDIVFVVETWLNPNISSTLVCPRGYNIIRRDRRDKKGGGVMVLYKNHLPIDELCYHEPVAVEFLCVSLIIKNWDAPICFLCAYLPPDVSQDKSMIMDFCKYINHFRKNKSCFYLIGDFNLPTIKWNSSRKANPAGQHFLDYCVSTGLKQHITHPTCKSGNTLDLLLCDEISQRPLHSIDVLPPLSTTCDHNIIKFSLYIETVPINCDEVPPSFDYDRGDFESMNRELAQINWPEVFSNNDMDIQRIYDFFLGKITSLRNKYVPLKRFRKHFKQPKHIIKAAKEKTALYHKLQSDNSLKKEYKQLSRQYDKLVSSWYSKMELKVCESRNSSAFYKYANKKLKSFSSIPPLKADNQLIYDDEQRAAVFNEFFHSVHISDNGIPLSLPERLSSDSCLHTFHISKKTIDDTIRSSNQKRSKTPDEIPSILLKKLRVSLNEFLYLLFNLSLQSGKVPSQWKCSLICPIHKKGTKSSAENYRPVSLTSSICRLLEKIICEALLHHLMTNNLLSSEQHGFLPGRSTTTQLLTALNDWNDLYYSNNTVSVVYTDLRKAFDKVSLPKLLTVLHSYGVRGELLKWFNMFLTNRTQHVTLNQCISQPLPVTSGVPQGSVVGPLLFLLYIDDITTLKTAKSKLSLFADDTKVYSTDVMDLQSTLCNLEDFFTKRQLYLAPEKCEVINFSKQHLSPQLSLGGISLASTRIVKDLGVLISDDLKWLEHVQSLTSKAKQRAYLILRSFNSTNIWILLKAYTTYVRPIMEYASSVWNPKMISCIDLVESVQQYFTKRACQRCRIPFTSYLDRLYKLNLKSLEYRRLFTDLVLTYKITHNLIDLKTSDFFSLRSTSYMTRSHNFQLSNDLKDNQPAQMFSKRTTPVWNKLPVSLFSPDTLESFLNKLKSIDLHEFAKLRY